MPSAEETQRFLTLNSEMWAARAEIKRNPAAAIEAERAEKKVKEWRRRHEPGFED